MKRVLGILVVSLSIVIDLEPGDSYFNQDGRPV
jgi:hypothetical protein